MTRIEKARAILAEHGLDAILVTDITNIGWLTGFRGSSGYAVLTQDRALFITDSRYRLIAADQVTGFEITIFQTPQTAEGVLKENFDSLSLKRIGFESASVTVEGLRRWNEKWAPVEFVPIADSLSQLRRVKDEVELGHIRAACAITDQAFEHIQRMIRPGVSEIDVELDLEFYIRRLGAGIAFPSIVVSGPNSASPHGHATERKMQHGDFVTLDFGATVEGYHSDITRTVVIGEASDRTKEVYATVLRSQLAALDTMKPGVKGSEVDHASREAMGDFAQYFGHGLGHTLGRLVHDGGGMGPMSDIVLEVGQVWTVEPGIYIPGFGGCRIEDDVVITQTGIEIFNKTPKDLLVVAAV